MKNCFQSYTSKNLLKDHLFLDHHNNLHQIEHTTWSNLDLYHCKKCTHAIFTNKGSLSRHTNIHHNTRYKTTQNNIERIIDTIPVPPSSTHNWDESLTWLTNLKIRPPPFRQNIWLKTNKNIQNKIIHLYHRLIVILTTTPNQTQHKPLVPALHKSEVIWKLLFIFESIILYPVNKPHHTKKPHRPK